MDSQELYKAKRNRINYLLLIWSSIILTLTILMILKVNGVIALNCPIYKYTGYKCPTCGMTSAFTSILNKDIRGAISYNHYVTTTGVIPLILLVKLSVEYVEQLEFKHTIIYLTVYTLTLIIYGVFRNILGR